MMNGRIECRVYPTTESVVYIRWAAAARCTNIGQESRKKITAIKLKASDISMSGGLINSSTLVHII